MRVGLQQGMFLDPVRAHWDGHSSRPIAWTAWYPAEDDVAETEMRIGPPSTPTMFDVGPVAFDAPFSRQASQCPVVVLSHGTGGSALSLGWLGRRLAQRGLVVLAVDHHGNTATEPYRAEGFLCWWERARDLSTLMDYANALGSWTVRLDMSRVYAVGFSLGCHTIVALAGGMTDLDLFQAREIGRHAGRGPREFPDLADRFATLHRDNAVFRSSYERHAASYHDERVKAALLLAPAPPVRSFTEESLARISMPVAMIVGARDAEAPPDDCTLWLSRRLLSAAAVTIIPGAEHSVFMPEATEEGRRADPVLCVDAPDVDRRSIHDAVATQAIALFSQ